MALSFRRLCLGLVVAASAGAGLTAAHAQFFNERYPFPPRGGFWDPNWEERPVDYSRAPAPAPRKPGSPAPTGTIVVLGDSMADYLAYGLEDVLADTPEISVVRKHKTVSGLLRYDARNENAEWPQTAREIIAAEKPNVVIVMLGLNDRQAIREKAPPARSAAPADPKKPAPGQPAAAAQPAPAANAENQSQDPEQPSIVAPERPVAARPGVFEFRSEKWEELYNKRIDDMVAAAKSANVPVLWVGLPPIRGAKSTTEASYLNELYRSGAEKGQVLFIDVWDGFIDDAGRFATQGPDVEGQIRRLRTADGVHFTKAGARKLAHFVERELHRGLLNQAIPVALAPPDQAPSETQVPVRPGAPAVRPLAGPVLILSTLQREYDDLLGSSRPTGAAAEDALARRVLIKGEPVTSAAGRADDFAWPARVPNLKAGEPLPPSGTPVAASTPPAPKVIAQPAATPGQTRVAGQPVLQGQIQPQQRQQQGWGWNNYGGGWRSPPQYLQPRGGFFGLFR